MEDMDMLPQLRLFPLIVILVLFQLTVLFPLKFLANKDPIVSAPF
jgi:hypothetical protein